MEQGSCNPWEQKQCLKEELEQVTRLWANYTCRLLWEGWWDFVGYWDGWDAMGIPLDTQKFWRWFLQEGAWG